MPKRILLIAFAVTALALAACNAGYNPNDLYGTPIPSATIATATPNPTITAAVVTVYASSAPLPNWQVSLYHSTAAGNAGSLIRTQTTDSTGTTTFTGLTPGTTYCFNSQYTPPGGLMQNTYICNFTWFNGVVFNFP
jgi:energy-converting hydrogenase Eha subunit F